MPSPSPSELRREYLLDPEVARLSVAVYTTGDEIDRLLAALARELDAEHGQRDE
jgi:selenocysteine lyase/cysteine desulfurase